MSSRLSVANLGHAVRSGLATPVIVLAMLAMVIVPLSPLVLDALFTDVREFARGAAQSDDITAMVLRYGQV